MWKCTQVGEEETRQLKTRTEDMRFKWRRLCKFLVQKGVIEGKKP